MEEAVLGLIDAKSIAGALIGSLIVYLISAGRQFTKAARDVQKKHTDNWKSADPVKAPMGLQPVPLRCSQAIHHRKHCDGRNDGLI